MADIYLQIDFLLSGLRYPDTDIPLSGGKVYTYLDGTSTLSNLKVDQAGAGAAANPVILGTDGTAEVYGDQIYKFMVYDSDDNLIDTLNGLQYKANIATTKNLGIDYGCDLEAAAQAIGSTTETELDVECACVIASGDSVTITDNISLNIKRGGSIGGSGTLTFAVGSSLEATLGQCFGDSLTIVGSPLMKTGYVEWFGAVPDDSTDNATSITNAFATGWNFKLLAGTYLSSTKQSFGTKGQIISGSGKEVTFLEKTNVTDGDPVLESAYGYIKLEDLTLMHTTLPTTAGNNGFEFIETDSVSGGGKGWGSMRNVFLYQNYDSITNDQAATDSGQFSWTFEDIMIRQFYNKGVYLANTSSGSSGSVFSNIYIANSRTDTHKTSYMFDIRTGSNFVINQLNIEANICGENQAVYLQNIRNLTVNGVHFEDVEMRPDSATAGRLISMVDSQMSLNGIHINGLKLDTTNDDSTPITEFAIIRVNSSGSDTQPQLSIKGLEVRDTSGIEATVTDFNFINADDPELDVSKGFSINADDIKTVKEFDSYITDGMREAFKRFDIAYVDDSFDSQLNTNMLMLQGGPEVTISGGEVNCKNYSHFTVDTEADAATDDLDTINGGQIGQILYLSPANGTRTVVIKNGTGNIKSAAGDISLDDLYDMVMLRYNGSFWVVLDHG